MPSRLQRLRLNRARVPSPVALAGIACILPGAAGIAAAPGGDGSDPVPTYARDIRPILADACFNCHGFDAAERKAGLRLDTPEGAYAEKDGVRSVAPGDLEGSELWHRIRSSDPLDRMPPPDFHHQLSPEQIDLLERWIAAGAVYEEHWAFSPPSRPPLPEMAEPVGTVESAAASGHPVDVFIEARLASEGVVPLGRADRGTQLRRLSLALAGLPPSPEEVAAFLAAEDEDAAYLDAVERLLGSTRHAEHLARHWLDAARYADTHGYQYDLSRHQWPWRDWVIRAYRDNLPFDRFTLEQLAGDLLPDASESQILATAFLRNHPITIEGGIIDEEYRNEYVVDRVATVGTVWLALSMECARCHDHKFDPVTSEDFYSLYAYFNRIPERGHGGQNRFAPTRAIRSPLLEEELAEARAALAKRREALAPHLQALDEPPGRREALENALLAEAGSWQPAAPVAISTGGADLSPLDDGSLLAAGPRPERDHYEFVLAARGPVAALRLEALPDATLPSGSVGRADNGNFVLTRVRAWANADESSERQELAIASASADYEQNGYPVSEALLDNGRGGWAVDGNTRAEGSSAVFALAQPLPEGLGSEDEWHLTVRLEFDWGGGHAIGRLRLALADRIPGEIPEDLVAALRTPIESRDAAQSPAVDLALLERHAGPEAEDPLRAHAAQAARVATIEALRPEVMVMQDLETPPPTYVLRAGLYDQPDPERPVAARPLSAFAVAGTDELPSDRLGLARWIVAPDHPLTARVLANRLWQLVYGIGLVATSEDLGTQGELPSHPELLDWLAVELVESGWDQRALLRLLATSEAFRRSSHASPSAYALDPDNRLLARGPRQRLDAEAIRDNALAIAGLLDARVGGPSVYPYHPEGLWEEVNNRPGFMETYEQGRGADLYRRSLYTFWKRAVAPPAMQIFDAPNRESCVVRRGRTNTPLQALVLLHEPGQVEAARTLASRMIAEGGDSPAARIARGFALALARPPIDEEIELLEGLLGEEIERFRADPAAARSLLAVGESPVDPEFDEIELAAHTMLARLILNLDETITRP